RRSGPGRTVRSSSGGETMPQPIVTNDVYDWLGPENVVKRYQTYGNAGVSGFEEQLKQWKERLGDRD
ncbi:MAG: hypothetical protein MJA84_13150, partial [Firmicutes bacterium]|nr:hypothetical protein [Bacillota bacterium]